MRRGDIYSVRLPKSKGHEQLGKRSTASFRPEVAIEGTATKVLVEQSGAVDITRLGDLAGHLTPEEWWGVDAAILTVPGLS